LSVSIEHFSQPQNTSDLGLIGDRDMRTIETLSLANVTQLSDEEFLLTLQVNQTLEEHTVKFTTDLLERMYGVDNDLREVLVMNPKVAPEIIRVLRRIQSGETVSMPVKLSLWEDPAVLERQVA
jgi:hypothetical protein